MSAFFKRLICLVLAFTMVFCALPAVNAQDTPALSEEVIYEEPPVETTPEEPAPEDQPGEEPAPEGQPGEEPAPEGQPGEEPAPEDQPGEEPAPEGQPGEEPAPEGQPGEEPAPEDQPGEEPLPEEEGEMNLLAEELLADPSLKIEDRNSRLILHYDSEAYADTPEIQWMRSETGAAGTYVNIDGAVGTYYDLSADDSGYYLRVAVGSALSDPIHIEGKVVIFDLAKKTVLFGTNGDENTLKTVTGTDPEGNPVEVTHSGKNRYVITQSDNANYTTNEVRFASKGDFTKDDRFNITLDGIHMGNDDSAYQQNSGPNDTNGKSGNEKVSYSLGSSYGFGAFEIPTYYGVTSGGSTTYYPTVKHVTLYLKGENIMRNLYYQHNSQKSKSTLTITHIDGDGVSDAATGSLYLPKKVEKDDIDEFVASTVNYNHWCSAIGGDDGSGGHVYGLIFNGGYVQALTTYGDNCTAIGAGGNDTCEVIINGGEIVAHCNGTGTAIGGGIGWNSAGGKGYVTINGGTVYAKNHGNIGIDSGRKPIYTTDPENDPNVVEIVGGVAIGGGSSFKSSGTVGYVTINGGTVEAYGTFGNAIGGGNSSTSTGGAANITITGGTVTASSMGGGNSQKGVGGQATINVKLPDDADSTTEAPTITLTNGIGGGKSLGDGEDSKGNTIPGTGGAATVNVSAGTLTVGGTIGGGEGGGTGNGGQATVKVTGGTLTARAIGGGVGSAGGNGGAADIRIEDGTIITGSIGGGTTQNPSGLLGYATAYIKGGDITGQFLMNGDDPANPCTFTMVGGTLHGVDTSVLLDPADPTSFRYTKREGGAVYMNDPKGVATISGGTIEHCKATDGGAIYMSAGTVNISGETTIIQHCEATNNGGAIYLGGGTLNISGGTLTLNKATNNGGAAYLGGGTLNITGGTLTLNEAKTGGAAFVNGGTVDLQNGTLLQNTATQNGGAVAVNNGSFTMTGGTVKDNIAQTGSGGGLYVSSSTSDVNVDIYSGIMDHNTAAVNGGALAVVGDLNSNKEIRVQIGVNKVHFDNNNNLIKCDHGREGVYDCPVLTNNSATQSGGAIYMTGNNDYAKLHIYCVKETGSTAGGDKGQSNFMRADGGEVLVATSEILNESTQTSIHGHSQIENTFYVTGGKVDLWGDTSDPYFKGVITVDIIDPDNNHFVDHRVKDGYYTLLYYENFRNPDTLKVSGQYKSYSYPVDDPEITIFGNIYEHPGYQITRWNTHPDGFSSSHNCTQGEHTEDADYGWYEIGSSKTLTKNLILYAIWDNIGYVVQFKANAPEHSGTMPDQTFDYDKEGTLNPNQFVYAGHKFLHWNTEPDDSGDTYLDQATVKNLAKQEGDLVTLYAIWEDCSHDPTVCTYTYSVINDGTAIQRVCSCQGYTETAALTGYNLVYDQNSHEVAFTVTSELASTTAPFTPIWNWKDHITLSYAKEGNPSGVPKNAGNYTASIKYDEYTAQVDCIIQKAEQPAPPKPEYQANISNTSQLDIFPVAASPIRDSSNPLYDKTYDAEPEYQVVYKVGDTVYGGNVWQIDSGNPIAATFNMDVALTNYYVYARYGECENYKASPVTEADSQHFFKGKIRLDIIPDRGTIHSYEIADQNGDVVTGIRIKVSAKDGFYFPNNYTLEIKTYKYDGEPLSNPLVEKPTSITVIQEKKNESYRLDNIPEGTYIVVTLPKLSEGLSISGMIDHGKQYGLITNTADVNISRDSAYTAYFVARNYDDNIYGGGATVKPCINFSDDLPVGTRITMQSRNADDTLGYYRYQVASATDSIELDEFIRMGTESTPFAPHDGTLRLRFVVDFSQVSPTNRIDVNNLSTTLAMVADQNVAANAPDASAQVETAVSDVATFELTAQGSGLEQTFTYTYNKSEGKASVWDNRRSALIISPKTATVALPADVHISYSIGATQRTRKIYPNGEGDFVIPLSYLEEGPNDVMVTLVSGNFPANAAYDMSARWMVSNTGEDNASNNGTMVASLNEDITFTKSIASVPALKIAAEKPSYPSGSSFEATAQWSDVLEADELTVYLMVKADSGAYTNTGWSTIVKRENAEYGATSDLGENVPVSLAGQREGSYCLHITAMRGLIRVAEDYYYFVVDSAQENNAPSEAGPTG